MSSYTHPPSTIPPWRAATEIRLLAKRLLRIYEKPTSGATKVQDIYKPNYKGGLEQIQGMTSYSMWKNQKTHTDTYIRELEEAIPTRKVALIKQKLLQMRLSRARELEYWAKVVRYSSDHLDQRSYDVSTYYKMAVANAQAMEGKPDGAESTVKEIARLAQCLPTVEHLPTTKQDTIIRAIVAILRAHSVEGVEAIIGETANGEDNTNVEKKVEGAGSIADALAPSSTIGAKLAAPVPAGTAPVSGPNVTVGVPSTFLPASGSPADASGDSTSFGDVINWGVPIDASDTDAHEPDDDEPDAF